MKSKPKELTDLAKAVRRGDVDADALVEYAYELFKANSSLRNQLASYQEKLDKVTLAKIQKEVRKRELLKDITSSDSDVWGIEKAFKGVVRLGDAE